MGQLGVSGRSRPGREGATSRILPTILGWALGIAVTAAILGTPYLLFAYHDPQLHLILDSADTGVALLVAFLIWGRYRRSGRLQDLLLAGGLLPLAVAGLGMTLGLHLLGLEAGRADAWLPAAIRVVGAVTAPAAAAVGVRPAPDRGPRALAALPWATVALGLAITYLLDGSLPLALAETPPASAQRPVISGHPALLVAHAVTAACFA